MGSTSGATPLRSERRSIMRERSFVALLYVLLCAPAPHAALAARTAVDCGADRSALGAAVAAASAGDVLTIRGTCDGTYVVDKPLSLVGAAGATLDGDGAGPVVTIAPDVEATLENLTITGGAAVGQTAVGGILNRGTLQIRRSRIVGNTATGVVGATGGIQSGPSGAASIVIDQSEIFENRASVESTDASAVATATGGLATAGSFRMTRTELRANRAIIVSPSRSRAFGAMLVGAGGARLDRVTVADNVAYAEHTGTTPVPGNPLIAGAIGGITHFPPDELVIRDSVIRDNDAISSSRVGSGSAGGMVSRSTTLIDTDVSGNTAVARTLAVAGIANHNAVLILDGSAVTENSATVTHGDGVAVGAIATGYFGVARTTLRGSRVLGNSAARMGTAIGALYEMPGNGTIEIESSQVEGNEP